MLELKGYQKKAVKQLKERIFDMLSLGSNRQKLVFKAPTGAGKTVMASALLDELNQELQVKMRDIAYIWIAPNKLHIQSYLAMRNFFSETRNLRPIKFDEVDTSEGLRSGEILFLNWDSINKENAVLIRDNENCRTLYRLTDKTHENGVPIIVIIDEEHLYAGKNAKKSELVLQNINPKIELRISATPETGGCSTVDIPREQVIKEEMIKKQIELNPQLESSDDVDTKLIDTALEKRDYLAKLYYQFDINPLLLIQLPNDKTDTLSVDEKRIVETVTKQLDIYHKINVENGRLAVWLSNEKSNLDGIEKRNSMVDVLLFKQAIALGWDCPRAAVLLIFRDLKSPDFTIQTVGRIMRMPEQRHYTNEALNYGYVYTNLSTKQIRVVRDNEMAYISTLYSKRRENIQYIGSLNSWYQKRRKTPHVLKSPFKELFKKVLIQEWDIPIEDMFGGGNGWDDLPEQKNPDEFKISENRLKAYKHGIQVDVRDIKISLPKDLQLTGNEEIVNVNDRVQFVKTYDQLKATFHDFCRKNVNGYEPGQSSEMIRTAIYEALEYLLAINEFDAQKVVLCDSNQAKFVDYIAKAANLYTEVYEKEEEERNAEEYYSFVWQLPDTRVYNTDANIQCEDIFNHALMPFFEEKNVSKPEKMFNRLLDKNNELIDWWYKNGDKGDMHFAVKYTDKDGAPRCFYVDYIIRMKSGRICLFDTKTRDSDPNASQKQKGLVDYIEEENRVNHKNIVGGIIIPDGDNWYYSTEYIENTHDLTNWKRLDLANI